MSGSDQVKYGQKLKGDRVLVIGGSSGIGFGVAQAALEAGSSVAITSSNAAKLATKIAQLQELYPSAQDRVTGHVCNLADEPNLEQNVATLFASTGELDHVVYTAGDSLGFKPLDEVDFDFAKKAGLVRFFAVLFVGKYAPRYMKKSPKSSITLTSGSVAERPMPNWTVVNSYASGVQGMTRGLALDLKPIRVNVISPGYVDTELWNSFMNDEQKQGAFTEAEKKLPTGKVGQVEDVAESYLFCMKNQNVTGTVVSTTGGSLLV